MADDRLIAAAVASLRKNIPGFYEGMVDSSLPGFVKMLVEELRHEGFKIEDERAPPVIVDHKV